MCCFLSAVKNGDFYLFLQGGPGSGAAGQQRRVLCGSGCGRRVWEIVVSVPVLQYDLVFPGDSDPAACHQSVIRREEMEQWIEAVRKVVFLVFYGELFIHAMAGSAYQKYIRYGLGLMVLILLIQPVFSLMNEGADPGKWLDETVLKEKKGEMEQWIFQMQKKS